MSGLPIQVVSTPGYVFIPPHRAAFIHKHLAFSLLLSPIGGPCILFSFRGSSSL